MKVSNKNGFARRRGKWVQRGGTDEGIFTFEADKISRGLRRTRNGVNHRFFSFNKNTNKLKWYTNRDDRMNDRNVRKTLSNVESIVESNDQSTLTFIPSFDYFDLNRVVIFKSTIRDCTMDGVRMLVNSKFIQELINIYLVKIHVTHNTVSETLHIQKNGDINTFLNLLKKTFSLHRETKISDLIFMKNNNEELSIQTYADILSIKEPLVLYLRNPVIQVKYEADTYMFDKRMKSYHMVMRACFNILRKSIEINSEWNIGLKYPTNIQYLDPGMDIPESGVSTLIMDIVPLRISEKIKMNKDDFKLKTNTALIHYFCIMPAKNNIYIRSHAYGEHRFLMSPPSYNWHVGVSFSDNTETPEIENTHILMDDQNHTEFPALPKSTPELVRKIIKDYYIVANDQVTETIVHTLRKIIDTNFKLHMILLTFEYTSSGPTPSL